MTRIDRYMNLVKESNRIDILISCEPSGIKRGKLEAKQLKIEQSITMLESKLTPTELETLKIKYCIF